MTTGTLSCDIVAEKDLVVRYVAGGLRDEQELGALEAHLLTCATCLEEVRLALLVKAELGAQAPGSTRSQAARLKGGAWWFLGTAAAAAAVLVLVLGRDFGQRGATGPVVRGGNEGVPHVATVSPVEGAVMRRDSLAFVWRSAGKDVEYKLTVTNEAGDVVWRAAGVDTARRVPRDVRLTGGQSYSWYVDALLPDGRSAMTTVQRFAVAR